MIPSLIVALDSYAWLALVHGYTRDELTTGELQACLDLAETLATSPADEPAALFFALAKPPGSRSEAWPRFPRVMGRNHAHNSGFFLVTSDEELEDLAWDICLEGRTYEHVRDWFRKRLRPR